MHIARILKILYIDEHLTQAEIGKKFGYTEQYIGQLLKKYDIKAKYASKVKITCALCQREKIIYRYFLKKQNFCSRECYFLFRKRKAAE